MERLTVSNACDLAGWVHNFIDGGLNTGYQKLLIIKILALSSVTNKAIFTKIYKYILDFFLA